MEILTEMEKAVLDRLADNPFAAQQEIAESLGIPRPTLAMHITQLTRKGYLLGRAYVLSKKDRLVCIGGSTIDTVLLSEQPILANTSNPVTTIHNFGGVARNVAENAARLGADVSLISLVGDDENGRSLIAHLKGLGVDTSGVSVRSDLRTATYTSVVTGNEAVVGFSDMEIFDKLPPEYLDRLVQHFVSATWVLADCNLPAAVILALLQRKKGARFLLALDAVSTAKAVRLPERLENIDALFLREEEARSYIQEELDPTQLARELRRRGAKNVAVISRDFSVAVVTPDGETIIPAPKANILDPGGANDTLVGTTLARLLLGSDFVSALTQGTLGAAITSEVFARIHPGLSPQLLEEAEERLAAGL
ncbi:PfkB family carbohydrate kinase [Agrobacterium tumefaciens]|uniref:Winged helix-turn-helix transcriptional regulator n=1 Tax=Agrobacterium tumefaciens TaxID=358 RepID=A0AA44FB07_AGRTU|nr:PfkB family carbohydrate kinase [Agrobacterium tumefaciens]NTC17160.1 winged helix-turn-helix transcriptional regulator [Agrobacterium tumefaciens]NTC32422.1 winged helix-turn-helix transcriptional regulator [Agrobacterium tumefaciens]